MSEKEGKIRAKKEGAGGSSCGKSLLSVCMSKMPCWSYSPILACSDSSKISKLFLTTASIKRACKRLSLLMAVFSSPKKGSTCPSTCVATTSERMVASLSCTSWVNNTIATANKINASITLAKSLANTERKPSCCIKQSLS